MESDPLVKMVVGGIVAAFILGFVAHKMRVSPIVGYLLAGVMLGPHSPGFTADAELARELADLGVILILFGVGLKFSVRRLMEYRWIALPGAIGQMMLVTALGLGASSLLGMGFTEGLIFGFSLSIASTIVLLRALENRQETSSPFGHLAVSWLIVQDLAAVFILVIIAAVAETQGAAAGGAVELAKTVGIKAVELAAFVLIMLVVGRRVLPALLVLIAKARSRELFSLGVFSVALGIAYIAHAVFGASFALGAFLAGLVLNEADLSHRAAEDLIPLRDAFAVLFFVSVGMLFDPRTLTSEGWTVLGLVAIVILGNGAATYVMATALRVPPDQSLLLAAGLAQIGEFSFLISNTGLTLDLVSERTHGLIAASALLAIAVNPLIRQTLRLFLSRVGSEPAELARPVPSELR
jgi:CPA2 family monovalent cation:H+ antiporter-2